MKIWNDGTEKIFEKFETEVVDAIDEYCSEFLNRRAFVDIENLKTVQELFKHARVVRM